MKHLIFLLTTSLVAPAVQMFGQRVAKADAVALLNEMPAPPTTLAGAYQRAYTKDASHPDAKSWYQPTTEKLTRIQQEVQTLLIQFYQQHPTGVPTMPQPSASRVSAKDKSAMDAATSELAQKMMTDKAFAQQFARMSETEQHAYITKLMAEKGLKPAQGVPNMPDKPMPGTDIDWGTPCNEFTQPTFAMERWEKQAALEQKYSLQHDAVNTWIETEIKKLPMISLGEYGHDYDPVQVKAIKKQGFDKHRTVADAMMKEAAEMFAEFRQQAKARCTPLNDALQKVQFGEQYNFGLNYTLVLQTQAMMFADLQTLLNNEMNIIEAVARWELEYRRL